jgi:hypothetical protein
VSAVLSCAPTPPLPHAPSAVEGLRLLRSNEPISCCADSHALSSRLLHALGRMASALEREDGGRHIRERSREAMQEAVADTMTDVLQRTLAGERIWRLGGRAQPLHALHESWLSEAVHHLCLLRYRIACGTLPSDVWRAVVFGVLHPCLCDFGYRLEGLPAVFMAPLPTLPSMHQRALLVERGTATDQDKQLLRALFQTWLTPHHEPRALPVAEPDGGNLSAASRDAVARVLVASRTGGAGAFLTTEY